jgi:hypothetical protein
MILVQIYLLHTVVNAKVKNFNEGTTKSMLFDLQIIINYMIN